MNFNKTFLRSAAIALTAGLLLTPDANAVVKKKKTGKGSARAAFEKGDNTLALGLGLGSVYSYTNASFLPAASVYFDHGLIGDVGPGTIGIGGTVGYAVARYKYSGLTDVWTNIVFGVRGTYHLTILKNKNNKFDPYGGITVGARAYSYKDDYYNTTSSSVYPYAGLFVGAKYNFVPAFGVWTELGYDISFLRLGINFNF